MNCGYSGVAAESRSSRLREHFQNENALTFSTLSYVALGVFIGLLVGSVPGLSAPMAIALCVPLTYYMPAVAAIGFLIGINKGGFFGGSISATLLNTPGTAEAAATALEGYPLARAGKGMRAIKMALYASSFGDIFSTLLLFVVAAPIASLALRMGPPEICSLIILSLTMIAVLEAGDLYKGIVAAFGMLISSVGMDPVVGEARLTFDLFQLESGVPLIPMCIGLLALSELFAQTEGLLRGDADGAAGGTLHVSPRREDNRVTFREYAAQGKNMLRSSLLGSLVGALPGLGAAVAAFLAYGIARNASKHPEEYGNGSLEGIAVAAFALGNGAGKLGLGFGWDKLGGRISMLAGMTCMSVGIAGLAFFPSFAGGWAVPFFAALAAIGFGGLFSLMSALLMTFYGPLHYGMNFAVSSTPLLFAAIAGPYFGSLLRQAAGRYQVTFLVALALCAAGYAMIFLIKEPTEPDAERSDLPPAPGQRTQNL